jgi:AraC-like DNA-binding protein/mannose-6-phosphate isomerase-like protein (cupin superfamily)
MVNKQQLRQGIAQATEQLKAPADLYHGRRRWQGPMVDNVLVFGRVGGESLNRPSVGPHFHHRWVLAVAVIGRATVLLDQQAFRLEAGTGMLIPPRHLHHYAEVGGTALRWLFITFDWPGRSIRSAELGGPRTLSKANWTQVDGIVKRWAKAGDATLLCAETLTLVMSLYPELESGAKVERRLPPEDQMLAAVRRELAALPAGRVTIGSLARRLGRSESHLRSAFRGSAGISLGRYLREWRLREAAAVLREETLTVKEVAERLGFPDVYSFSRAFKRVLGVPPSSLRT